MRMSRKRNMKGGRRVINEESIRYRMIIIMMNRLRRRRRKKVTKG